MTIKKPSAPAPAPAAVTAPAAPVPASVDQKSVTPPADAQPTLGEPELPKLVEGEKALISAIYGDIINPNTLQRFTTDAIVPVVVDGWIAMQHECGKLKAHD